jgi:uncharacterized phage protein gp47/JayE
MRSRVYSESVQVNGASAGPAGHSNNPGNTNALGTTVSDGLPVPAVKDLSSGGPESE